MSIPAHQFQLNKKQNKLPDIQPNERDLQTWVKDQLSKAEMWYSQCHPGLGSDVGLPDLFVLCEVGLIPVELKIGTIDDDVLWTSAIRPSQIRWHSGLNRAGGCSVVLVGVWGTTTGWQILGIDALFINQHENGFRLGEECEFLDADHLAASLDQFVFDSVEMAG